MCELVQLESFVKQYTIANAEYLDDRVPHCVYKRAGLPEVKAKMNFTECSSAAILADTHKVDGPRAVETSRNSKSGDEAEMA